MSWQIGLHYMLNFPTANVVATDDVLPDGKAECCDVIIDGHCLVMHQDPNLDSHSTCWVDAACKVLGLPRAPTHILLNEIFTSEILISGYSKCEHSVGREQVK